MDEEFVFVDEFVSGIRWDAKYATWDNFTGKPVDGYLTNRIVGTKALCAALERAREGAAFLGFGLLLWDGYRPQRAVECFVRWSEQPEDGRTKQRHYPNIDRAAMFEHGYVASRSAHSRGGTIDLTLFHLETCELVPMGGDFDLMDAVSRHGAKGVSLLEARNRRALPEPGPGGSARRHPSRAGHEHGLPSPAALTPGSGLASKSSRSGVHSPSRSSRA